MEKTVGFYEIVKLCKGGLVLTLPTFDSSANEKVIDIPWNSEKVRVPRAYALGIFTDGVLERMYKEGYFKVEPVADFEKEVEQIFYPVEDKVTIVPDSTIIEYLTKGNRVEIKKLMAEGGNVNKDKVIILAREHIDNISTSMVKDLETILGVELTIDESDAADEQ